jgi:hypothetical protein
MASLSLIDGRVTTVTGSNTGHGPATRFAKLERWSPLPGFVGSNLRARISLMGAPLGFPKTVNATAILSRIFSALCCASQSGRMRRRMLGQREAVLVIFQLLGP